MNVTDKREFGSGLEKLGFKDDNKASVPCVQLTDPRLVEAGIDPSTLYGNGITEEELQVILQRVREKKLEDAKKEVENVNTEEKKVSSSFSRRRK